MESNKIEYEWQMVQIADGDILDVMPYENVTRLKQELTGEYCVRLVRRQWNGWFDDECVAYVEGQSLPAKMSATGMSWDNWTSTVPKRYQKIKFKNAMHPSALEDWTAD